MEPGMRDAPFFQGVPQHAIPWRGSTVMSPSFYYDFTMLTAMFLAPLRGLAALLPSRRLYPLRITPWHGVLYLAAYEYRDTDIGPYNEVAISIPVSMDRPSIPFTGILWPRPAEPDGFLVHLPVTTAIAMDLGVESAAYQVSGRHRP